MNMQVIRIQTDKKKSQLSVRLNPNVKKAIMEEAEKSGVTLSEKVNEILINYLKTKDIVFKYESII